MHVVLTILNALLYVLCTSTLSHFLHAFFFICNKPVDLMDSSRKGPLADTSNSGNLNKTFFAIHYLQMPAVASVLGLLPLQS
jgi:hypothetical protein